MDGLIAAAGIQQETPALEYTAQDANTMFEVNVTGVFMTSKAVAKQMIRFGNGGSIALIASMSGTIANRVRSHLTFDLASIRISPPFVSLRASGFTKLVPLTPLRLPLHVIGCYPTLKLLTGLPLRVLSALLTMLARLQCFNLPVTSPWSGARTTFESTPSRPATLLLPWLRSSSLSSLSVARNGPNITCWDVCLPLTSTVALPSSFSVTPAAS